MIIRVIVNSPDRTQPPIAKDVLDADAFMVDPRTGVLTITKLLNGRQETLVCYAAGVWRTVADVGAFEDAKRADNADSGRRLTAR